MKKVIRLTENDLIRIVKRVLNENINEALKPSQYREYVKSFNRERYVDIFKNLGNKYNHDKDFYRIYIPLNESQKSGPISNIENEVTDFLKKNGYEVIDYIKGSVRYGDSKNITTIGKALTKLNADDLMKKFISDESRKALTSDVSKLMVVLSRHPYDIAGSDTDRNWTNCMTMGDSSSSRVMKLTDEKMELENKLKIAIDSSSGLGSDDTIIKLKNKINSLKNEINDRKEMGQNVRYLLNDVKEGSLISYLITSDDKNINNPIAVLNIKPYINSEDKTDFILISDTNMYGQGRPEFKKTIDNILNEINSVKSGLFCLKDKIYVDSDNTKVFLLTPEQEKEIESKSDEIISSMMDKIRSNFDKFWNDELYRYEISLTGIFDDLNLSEKSFEKKMDRFYNFVDKNKVKIIKNTINNFNTHMIKYGKKIDKTEITDFYRKYLSDTKPKVFEMNKFIDYILKNYITLKYNNLFSDLLYDELNNITHKIFNIKY